MASLATVSVLRKIISGDQVKFKSFSVVWNMKPTDRQTERDMTFHYVVTESTTCREHKQTFTIKLPLQAIDEVKQLRLVME